MNVQSMAKQANFTHASEALDFLVNQAAKDNVTDEEAVREMAAYLRVKSEMQALQQQLAAAREDSRRIDWIALQGDEFSAGIIVDAPGDGDYYAHGHRRGVYGTGKTFRDAVDAAIAAEAAIDATLQRDRQP